MCGARDGKTHFPAGQVGDATDRVNGFIGGASRDDHVLTSHDLGRKEGRHVVQQLIGFQHAAIAYLATGLVALPHVKHVDAVCLQLRHVALRGRVSPHFPVHGRGQNEWHGVERARQAHEAEQIIGPAVEQFGHEIGTGRGNHDGVGLACEVDVSHVVAHPGGIARIPLRGEHRSARQCLHGHRRDELHGRIGHHNLHRGARLDEGAAQLSRFVTGDTP